MKSPSPFARLFAAGTVSNLGDGVTLAALPLLAATLTRDPAGFAVVVAAMRLPWLVLALPAGVLADRVDRRPLVAVVNLVRGVVVGLVALAAAGGWVTIGLLAVAGFLLGSGEVVADIAFQGITPSVVARDRLERANGRMFAAEIAANQFVGPPLGAALFAVGAGLPFGLDAVSFFAGSALVASLPRPPSDPDAAPPQRGTIRADVAEAIRFLFHHPVLRTLAVVGAVMNAMWTACFTVLALYALEVLGTGGVGFGLLLTASGVGLAVGYVGADRLIGAIGRGGCLLAAIAAQIAMGLALGLSPAIVVAVVAFALFGVGEAVWNVVAVSLRQAAVPDRLFGRVNSAYRFVQWGSMPVGAALGGWLAGAFGLRAPWLVSAAVLSVAMAAGWRHLSNRAVERARDAVAA